MDLSSAEPKKQITYSIGDEAIEKSRTRSVFECVCVVNASSFAMTSLFFLKCGHKGVMGQQKKNGVKLINKYVYLLVIY
jgi:hypothetical protein